MQPLTDEAVKTDAEEWLGVLSQLWIAYDKPLDPDRLTIYQEHLSGVPLGLLESAIKRVIREHQFNSVPTIAEVWIAVRKELGSPVDIQWAIERWCEQRWLAAVHYFGGEPAEETTR